MRLARDIHSPADNLGALSSSCFAVLAVLAAFESSSLFARLFVVAAVFGLAFAAAFVASLAFAAAMRLSRRLVFFPGMPQLVSGSAIVTQTRGFGAASGFGVAGPPIRAVEPCHRLRNRFRNQFRNRWRLDLFMSS
jgi:hypothetical protein